MRTRTKICGITRVEDARAAVDHGADAIGFVFYPPSPRAVTAVQAQQIAQVIPPYVQIVGLFVDATLVDIQETLQHVALDVLQFHGQETPSQCAHLAKQVGRRWYKAIQVHAQLDVHQEIQRYCQAGASAVLLDAWHPVLKGGTGHSFDWSVFPTSSTALILAGGLTPENVKQAITITTPFAVDVSGGVESAKGIKDHQLIKAFMQGVHCGSANED
ncbi:phosphoribosylanthranilate isomerase [Acinetobacter sp. B5B]|uniref:phosphoribosylanthranilate isomerase n=1 Tax=Acinetobacter baretiae TaxID=2605383 RepID=UPI0018C26460|nr:phosphoribosylanthranilate isomerase [Acinetobacter baretiae]MBF7682350.1 phosphoribosylanthranilate isomerase [Acinetobacter baretiae]MBF7685178.1 phosphoribosylanthranilate isomerase [Acinetobacter baretiae]